AGGEFLLGGRRRLDRPGLRVILRQVVEVDPHDAAEVLGRLEVVDDAPGPQRERVEADVFRADAGGARGPALAPSPSPPNPATAPLPPLPIPRRAGTRRLGTSAVSDTRAPDSSARSAAGGGRPPPRSRRTSRWPRRHYAAGRTRLRRSGRRGRAARGGPGQRA